MSLVEVVEDTVMESAEPLSHGERPGFEWRLVPISTPLCTDCGGGGQVPNQMGGRTWCRLCDGSGVLAAAATEVLDDDRKGR